MKKAIVASLIGLSVGIGFGEQAKAGEVYNREMNQQNRIYQGVKNGSLSPGEFRSLERKEGRLNATRRADLKANNGHLTPQEYKNLNARENQLSNKIYNAKHN